MEWIALISTLGSVVIPPLFSLVKGIFGKGKGSDPEQTIGDLATTKPEVVAPYVQALSQYKEAEVHFFNRDIAGVPSTWVVDLRACIRPLSVILSFLILFMGIFKFVDVPPGVIVTCQVVIGNWIGTKIEVHS